ncbi:MAG: cation-transporting P-type ATPase [Alphaproteobacteria bacterium]|nr:cation-transporting P-type ATPase [Alphaproteobacteria bacterium]
MDDIYQGLTDKQVLISRNKYGVNQMPRPKLRSSWDFLKEVFQDKLNIILSFMMIMFIALSFAGYGSIYEAIGIGVVLIVVAITTVSTKMKTQKSAEILYQRANLQYVNVIRNGKTEQINSTDVVIGDIIKLQAGEKICADGYLVAGALDINNAILNGESKESKKTPVNKNFVYNEHTKITADSYTDKHSLFAGTTVLGGNGLMRVARIGANTENAKIMSSLWTINDTKTNLQIQLDKLADLISKIGTISAALIFTILLLVHFYNTDTQLDTSLIYVIFSNLTIALTIFVAAVPEGLPFIIGIITSQNVNRMIKSNILAKKPAKIPEAGNLQMLCTDKTGTLTYGFMQAIYNFTGNGNDIGFADKNGGYAKELFIKNVVMTCDCAFDSAGNVVGGNLTGRALLLSLESIAAEVAIIQQENSSAQRIPFNSKEKFSAVKTFDDGKLCYYLGAPEIILDKVKEFIDVDGKVKKLNKKLIQKLIKENAQKSMRMVATAYSKRWVDDNNELPDDLVLISVVAMRDEIRTGVNDVIKTLNKSNVQVMMITGDNLDTARAIAIDCGIISGKNDIAINAIDFDNLSDDEAKKTLHNVKVIARATPTTKLRVVQLAQSMNKSIGMCGDGTNDAPALKSADVGFAMGNGTDVCKEASDIIITDNNFLSVANCILLGRTFVHNVVNFLRFQLPINFTLVILSIVFPIMFGFDAFTAVQILIVNIVMDSLNSLAFGGEPPHKEYLSETVKTKNTPLLSKDIIAQIIWTTAGFCGVFAILQQLHNHAIFNDDVYMSARFALLVIMAVMNGFCVRTNKFNLFDGLYKNPMFIIVAVGIISTTIFAVTFGGLILQLTPLSPVQWLYILGLAFIIIPINYIWRFINRK